ncbi:MAG: hypothetical protein GC202_12965 [Alphaproteobacteria bacterium]|nr:hypothetical protein [Alphaproteobacteria bacterium]
MIRIATWLWIAVAGLMGYGLYQLKHEVIALENDLNHLNRQIVQEQENIHVLKAEWSYVTQPSRLQTLARRYLDLQPMAPKQFARLDALPAMPAASMQAVSAAPALRAGAPLRATEMR